MTAPDWADLSILDLQRARDAARAAGDYATADAIRAELLARGWRVEDSRTGSTLVEIPAWLRALRG